MAGDTVLLAIPVAISLSCFTNSDFPGFHQRQDMQTLYPLPATNPALSSGQPGPWQGGFQDGEFSPGSSILPPNTLRCRQMPLQDPSQAKLAAQAGPSETSLVCMMVNKDPAAASVLETTAGSLTSLLQLQHSPRGFPDPAAHPSGSEPQE